MPKKEGERKRESLKEKSSYNPLCEKAVKMKLILHNYPKVKIISLQVRSGKLFKSALCLKCAFWDHQERSVCRTGLNAPVVNNRL